MVLWVVLGSYTGHRQRELLCVEQGRRVCSSSFVVLVLRRSLFLLASGWCPSQCLDSPKRANTLFQPRKTERQHDTACEVSPLSFPQHSHASVHCDAASGEVAGKEMDTGEERKRREDVASTGFGPRCESETTSEVFASTRVARPWATAASTSAPHFRALNTLHCTIPFRFVSPPLPLARLTHL